MSAIWPTAPLGQVAPKKDAAMPCADELVWNLSLEDVEAQTGRVLSIRRILVSELGSAKCSFDERHILYSKLRPYLNKVVLPTGLGVGTSELVPLLPDSTRVEREFLAWYLRSPEFLNFANANTRGANLPRVSLAEIWKHHIPLPPISEQRRIVARIREMMERVDEIRRLRGENERDARRLRSAFRFDQWNALLGRGVKLSALGTVVQDSRNGLYKPRPFHGRGTALIRMFNILGGRFDASRLERLEVDSGELARYRVSPGDIIVSRVNSREQVGKSAVFPGIDEDAVFEAMIIRLTVDDTKADPWFVGAMMSSPQFLDVIRGKAKHAIGQSSISQGDLLTTEIPLPALTIQRQVAVRVRQWEHASLGLGGVDDGAVTALPAAILRKAFAGEL